MAALSHVLRPLAFAFASALALCLAALACGSATPQPVVQDIVVSFDPPSPADRSPLAGPSARRTAAGRELRALLGHGLAIEIDAALSPEYRDTLDEALTRTFEELATALEKLRKRDPAAFAAAQKRLGRIAVRYSPGSPREVATASFEGDDAVVITKATKHGELVPTSAVMGLLDRTADADRATSFAKLDPRSVAAGDHEAYLHWLQGWFDRAPTAEAKRERDLERIGLGLRFASAVKGTATAERLDKFLIEHGVRELAMARLGNDKRAQESTEAVARWLEQDFERLSEESRAQALDILLGRGLTNARLRETAFALSARVVDAWARAGHPLPGDKKAVARDFEVVVCPHPKNAQDGRSLGPRCEGGIVRLSLADSAQPAGQARLGALLSARNDPILVEHVMVSAGYSTYEGGERKLFALLRAIETDTASLRAALRVLAEDHAHSATIDVWLAEMRRLWLARPAVRGSILYVLAHLDPYGNGKIDFADFAGDFGARVTAEEARAYFAEGYRAISMAATVWPAFARDFSRAALLRPALDAWLDDPRVARFRARDPYEALVQMRHRLCDEEAEADLNALSAHFAERVKSGPGKGLDDMKKTFDPKTCDPPCAEMRGDTCIRRMRPEEVAKRRKQRGQ